MEKAINIGDYILFGTYNEEPIIWRIINKDDDGDLLLWSEYIISYKAFDGAESGRWKETGGIYTNDCERQMYGSNRWYNSNLRQWLNSDRKRVNYTTQPPISSAIRKGYNAYDDEAGFLFGFTSKEKRSIKQVNRRVLLAEMDKENADGGRELHKYEYGDPKEAMTNYDIAFYENLKDKVFLLSIQELTDYVHDREYDCKKTMTQEALNKNQFYNERIDGETDWYWFRTPSTSCGATVRDMGGYGFITDAGVSTDSLGVVPALYIYVSSIQSLSGQGTKENPYISKE